jgi:hypothetical protein
LSGLIATAFAQAKAANRNPVQSVFMILLTLHFCTAASGSAATLVPFITDVDDQTMTER